MLLNKVNDVRFEVLTLMIMKSTIIWDIMPCSKTEIHQSSFEGHYNPEMNDVVLTLH
jgi:hypothetical protein